MHPYDGFRTEPPLDARIAARATAQHGVVSRRQLVALGLGRGAIEARLRTGRLHRVHHGVYAVGHERIPWRGRLVAAVLACGPGSALSHGSAAAHLGIRRSSSSRIDVAVPRDARRAHAGLRVHRLTSLTPDEVTTHEGIPTTTPARTALDLAATEPRRRLERLLDEMEHTRVFDLKALRAVIDNNPGHQGTGALARTLQEHTAGTTLTRNDLEELFLALCAEHGLPTPEVNTPIGPYEADFLFRDESLIIETDGDAFHRTRRAREHDRTRDAWLTRLGYRVERFSDTQIEFRPKEVAATLRVVLGP